MSFREHSRFHRALIHRALTLCSTIVAVSTFFAARLLPQDSWAQPEDGWSYAYEAEPGEAEPGVGGAMSLDGTFDHENGSDSWDGSTFADGNPGGAEILEDDDGSYLRIQDTGDPRGDGVADPSNRKLYFTHDLTAEGAGPAALDDGMTLNFRARIPTDGPLDDLSGGLPYPEGGDGYGLHNGGKGTIGIKQANGGLISFSLSTDAGDDATGLGPGLLMNALNGSVVSPDVDNGGGGVLNVLPIDPTEWHEYWVTIEPDLDLLGTHLVSVYIDGDEDPEMIYSVTAGNGSDADGSYLAIGHGSTGFSGALDLDFVRVSTLFLEPESACQGARVPATRSIDRPRFFPGDLITVTITVGGENVEGTLTETIPEGFTIEDNGGGNEEGNTLRFGAASGGTLIYSIRAPADVDDCGALEIRGVTTRVGGCPGTVAGDSRIQNATADLAVTRSLDSEGRVLEPGEPTLVTLSVSGLVSETSIVESLPDGWTVSDSGGGMVEGSQLTFLAIVDGDIQYELEAPTAIANCLPDTTVSGTATPLGGCATAVDGTDRLACGVPDLVCEFGDDSIEAEYIVGFQFGVRPGGGEACVGSNGDPYTLVEQTSPLDVAYDEARGWGFEVVDPGNPDRGGWAEFGPFDDSPNDRNRFVGSCPEELYDSFMGSKDFPSACNEIVVGDPDSPCTEGGLEPAGAVFRIDLQDEGCYRFVAVIGDADNPHAHRVVVEDGGEGGPIEIGDNAVVLVENYDQNQQENGQVREDCLGCGVFARVGFDDKLPPEGDGIEPDPVFVNMDAQGRATGACPDSPVLEVEEGYIRIHLLQGNANVGPGSRANGTQVDVNGGDIVMLEVWLLDDCPSDSPGFRRGDVDDSATLTLTDAVNVLQFLFLGGEPPACMDAADADNNGVIQLTDGPAILNFLFLGGPPPPSPGHEVCGPDPADPADPLDCQVYNSCGA